MADPVQPLSDLLSEFSTRLAAVEGKLGLEGGAAVAAAPSGGGGGASDGAAAPFVTAYDAYCDQKLKPFVAACEALGPVVAELGDIVNRAWAAQRGFLVMVSKCKKPSDQSAVMGQLKDLQGVFGDAKAFGVDAKFANHSKSINEGLQICQWVLMAPPASLPADYAGEMIGASDFWANKLRMEHKNTDGGPPHIAFATTFKELMQGLVAYIKDHHKTGVSWNFQGVEISSYSGAAAAAPAAAPKAPAAASAATSSKPAGGGLGDVFAGIKKLGDGSSAAGAAGLKTVTNDMQTWRDEYKGDKPAPVKKAIAKRVEEKPTKPPVCELQRDKWIIENQSAESGVCTVEGLTIKQQVYIYGCIGATIVINGKAKNIILDKCKKTQVVLESVVSSVETVNCQRVKIQIKGTCPSVAIDKTDGCTIYLSKEAMGAQLITSKSSEMNVSFPNPKIPDEMLETCIPEQFVHSVVPETGKVSSDVSELYAS